MALSLTSENHIPLLEAASASSSEPCLDTERLSARLMFFCDLLWRHGGPRGDGMSSVVNTASLNWLRNAPESCAPAVFQSILSAVPDEESLRRPAVELCHVGHAAQRSLAEAASAEREDIHDALWPFTLRCGST